MSDLISRQDAINVADAVWSVTGDKNVAKVWDQIKDLPSAQTERKWIPCSERLPEIEDHHVSKLCIVCCKTEVEGRYVYGFAELEENIFGQVGWNCERDDEYHEPIGEVIAWMPMPEPYKGDPNE